MKPPAGLALFMMIFGLSASAGAPEASSLAVLKGQFAFNWHSAPDKQKCIKIDDKRVAEFQKNYECDLTEKSESASGKPFVTCTQKAATQGKTKEYMIFKTQALCEDERETQMANGD
jgi:hypothetical protein